MADPNISDPYLPSSQWLQGEGVDNTKLHQRVDVPLDALGVIDRAWGQQFDYFFGAYYGGALTAGANIPFTALSDTAGGWDTVADDYVIQNSGMFLIGGQIRTGTASTLQAVVSHGATDYTGPKRASGTNVSAGVAVPIRAIAGDLITFSAVGAVTFDTTATYIANWFYVVGIGW